MRFTGSGFRLELRGICLKCVSSLCSLTLWERASVVSHEHCSCGHNAWRYERKVLCCLHDQIVQGRRNRKAFPLTEVR